MGKIPWRRKWQPIPVFLPGEFSYSSWVAKSWTLLSNYTHTEFNPCKVLSIRERDRVYLAERRDEGFEGALNWRGRQLE